MVIIFFILVWPFLYFLGKNSSKNFSALVRLRRMLALLSSGAAGISYKVKTDEPVDWSRNYIICANHTSNLDITALMKVCKSDFSFMGKDELLHNPVTGFFFRTIDIPVNRSSKISAYKAFKRAEVYLNEGKSIAIFPEGGISDEYPPKLQTFKNGVFKLAVDLNIPILPVVIEDAWKIHWDDGAKYDTKPGRVNVHVLKPVEVSELNLTADELHDLVYKLYKVNWII
ncbi:1-acyl-sn-glycerol-3-phosphate acyltransferase [Albibacterium bauzanense]|uniref:1-acyl-sn-glycerol-3-phosphate acyltransferase n=1 Tax=Albibacterium bauzanense TaxID=653929 RepID=A0A4V2PY87_9SPHI|nr:1-acyl-sn-glycerol-3-phosphate acyltransferase [Albibacterium bauzanense]